MTGSTDYDRRIADWLEEGAQSVPDWLVEAALDEAHGLPQVGARWSWPWLIWPRPRWLTAQTVVSLAAGALGALAVITAFSLGLLSNQVAVDPSPSPNDPVESPLPSGGAVVRQPLDAVETIAVLSGQQRAFYTLTGLAATDQAVWTVAVYEDEGGSVVSSLVRVDATSGAAIEVPLENAAGLLSPPTTDGRFVWTASDAALHRISAADLSVTDFLLDFDPVELSIDEVGLWVARQGGTTLIDPVSGAAVREISMADLWADRIIGSPRFGALWACANDNSLLRLDDESGEIVARIALPADAGLCNGPVTGLTGADGMADAVAPGKAGLLVDPSTNEIITTVDAPHALVEPAVIGGKVWFVLRLAGQDRPLGLAPFDPSTGRLSRILTLAARSHGTTAFDSSMLLVAGDYLWMLADSDTGDGGPLRPNLIRIPLGELR